MRRGLCAGSVLALLCGAPALFAQSVSIDEDEPPSSRHAPAPSAAKPAVLPAEPVALPRALSTPVEYPVRGQGEQEVVLELTVSIQGTVTAARVISGAAPFADSALDATKTWLFAPAKRGTETIAAKIRFAVHFLPPFAEPEPRAPASASPPVQSTAKLPPGAAKMQEILVLGRREPIRHTLSHADVNDMPGAFGDPYRAIEALPGVVPIASGLPYFYVRGAPPGNVGYFFDGIPVPYLYHFAAGPGVLSPAFVDHVDLYPGAYPARYGRFAGAIVAGEMAPPSYRLHGEATIRLIDSGATIEAPFAGGRGSVMVGGRFSYTAAVLSLIVPNVSLSYWDYQGRARYDLDADNSVEILSFGAGDFLSDIETQSVELSSNDPNRPPTLTTSRSENDIVDVGFHRLDLRWDHRIPGGNWRNALMLGLDRTGGDNGNVEVTNHMIGARTEYHQALNPGLTVRAGADALFESLAQKVQNENTGQVNGSSVFNGPSTFDDNPANNDADLGFNQARRDFTSGAWLDAVFAVTPKIEVTPGLRADLFVSGGRVALSLDPRISARYALTRRLAVTHGLALVHQAPSFVVPVPGFKPSLAGGLQSALQYSAGLSYSLPQGFESSLALFQNDFFNMTDLISVIQLENAANHNVTDVRATGHAYGAELMVRRSLAQNVGGFVSYTLSRSVRSTGNLQGPATTDRTHVLNVALSGNLGRNWRLGGRWLFYSGIPASVTDIHAAQAPPRTPPFWRLDVKLQKRWYIKSPDAWWGVVFEVLNTTLNKEVLSGDCLGSACTFQSFGPVTVPSVGAEGAF